MLARWSRSGCKRRYIRQTVKVVGALVVEVLGRVKVLVGIGEFRAPQGADVGVGTIDLTHMACQPGKVAVPMEGDEVYGTALAIDSGTSDLPVLQPGHACRCTSDSRSTELEIEGSLERFELFLPDLRRDLCRNAGPSGIAAVGLVETQHMCDILSVVEQCFYGCVELHVRCRIVGRSPKHGNKFEIAALEGRGWSITIVVVPIQIAGGAVPDVVV